MWLVGAVIGRWWAVPLGAIIWVLLVVLAVQINMGDLGVVAVLGAANTAVGLILRQVVRRSARLVGRLTRTARA
jgi:hypothetical protein